MLGNYIFAERIKAVPLSYILRFFCIAELVEFRIHISIRTSQELSDPTQLCHAISISYVTANKNRRPRLLTPTLIV